MMNDIQRRILAEAAKHGGANISVPEQMARAINEGKTTMSFDEIVAEIKSSLKSAFPKHTFSIRRRMGTHSRHLTVTLVAGPTAFNYEPDGTPSKSAEVNRYQILPTHLYKQGKEFFDKVKSIVTKRRWDESDSQVDYFSTNFYYSIGQGDIFKPFVLTDASGKKPLDPTHTIRNSAAWQGKTEQISGRITGGKTLVVAADNLTGYAKHFATEKTAQAFSDKYKLGGVFASPYRRNVFYVIVNKATTEEVEVTEAKRQKRQPEAIYFNSYTAALNAARAKAEKKGYQIDEDDWNTRVTHGFPSRPAEGETTNIRIRLLKDGKPVKPMLIASVYGMKTSFELTSYVSESVEGGAVEEGREWNIKYGTSIRDVMDEMGKSGWKPVGKVGSGNFSGSIPFSKGNSKAHLVVKSGNPEKWVYESVEGLARKEAAKTYHDNPQIGKSRHSVSFHGGEKFHKDGSPFFDLRIFKSEKDKAAFIRRLEAAGYIEEAVEVVCEGSEWRSVAFGSIKQYDTVKVEPRNPDNFGGHEFTGSVERVKSGSLFVRDAEDESGHTRAGLTEFKSGEIRSVKVLGQKRSPSIRTSMPPSLQSLARKEAVEIEESTPNPYDQRVNKAKEIAKQIKDEAKARGVTVYASGDDVITATKEFPKGDLQAFMKAYRDCDMTLTHMRFTSRSNQWGCESAGFGVGAQECVKSGRVTINRSGGGGQLILKALQGKLGMIY